MSGSVDVAATSAYLHRVMNRCTNAAFGSQTADAVTIDDMVAPPGVALTLRRDGRNARLLDGSLRFEPPLPATDAAALFERVVTLGDDSLRVLLRVPAGHPWSRFGPTRVTLAFPVRPSASTPVTEARIVFPDRTTSPTGVVIGSTLCDARMAPIDLVAHTGEGGPVRALVAVTSPPEPDTVEHSSGVLWCDDMARLVGGPNHCGTWFGMAPTFVPVATGGVDETWGFVWDRPDRPIDDGLLFRTSRAGHFGLEEVRATAHHFLAEMRESPWTDALAQTPDEGRRASSAIADGAISRHGIVEVDAHEQWLGMTNGDAIRVPIDSVEPAGQSFSGSLIERIEDLTRRQLADGHAGSAYRTAYDALITAGGERRAFELHAAYAAMIAPLKALGRDVIAGRCAAIISSAAPMCHEVEGMEWSTSRTTKLVAYDVRGLIEPGSKLRIDVAGAKVVVDTMAMRPLRLSDLPTGSALELFESGAIEPARGGGFESKHGKPIIAAVVDGRLVVGSVWDLPQGPGVSVEAVVDWRD